jgi:DNA gyrase subunit B
MSKKKNNVVENSYNAESIKSYEGTEAIRKLPGMYIGDIGTNGIMHLTREAFDNSLDEFTSGFCTTIDLDINEKQNKILIRDNGRGIPVEKIEELCTKLHSSGKYDDSNYSYSIGLHGIGMKAICALSDEMTVIVYRDGKRYKQDFSKGKVTSELKVIGETNETGTCIYFHPDKEVMEDIDISYKDYYDFCEKISFLNKGLEINFHATKRDGKEISKTFCSKEGLKDYITYLEPKTIVKPICIETSSSDGLLTEIALSYKAGSDTETIVSFCNGVQTVDGGTHETGMKQGLTLSILKYIKDKNILTKKDEKLDIQGEDTRTGIITVVTVKHPKPRFEGQTKTKLANTDATSITKKVMMDDFYAYLEENPDIAKKICTQVIQNAKGRIAAKRAKQAVIKKNEGFMSLSKLSKFTDCASKDPSKCELFVTEGDSFQVLRSCLEILLIAGKFIYNK